MSEVVGADQKINILLVDDRPDGLITLQAVLDSPHYNLVTASSGTEALAQLWDHDFAVILLDVQMPGMDGFETACLIKRRERSRDIPIIFVTAINKDPVYIFRGYEVGAVDYITKPFDPKLLRSKVAVFVELYQKNRLLLEQAELLKRSEEKHRLVVESAGDIVMTLSLDATIVSLNPAFERITGYRVADWIGKSLAPLIHSQDAEKSHLAWNQASKGESLLFELRLVVNDERVVDAEASVIPLIQEGQLNGILAMIRDVSVRKQMEQEKQQREELERSNWELEQFAHICSHDLQEPLRLVVSYSQLLERRFMEQLGKEGDAFIVQIVGAAKRMSQLVQDLLIYSRLGAPEVAISDVSFEAVSQEAINNLRVTMDEARAKVRCGALPTVKGSKSQLLRVMQNLIGNAIKFRRDGVTPEIEVSARLENDHWLFQVRDNGIGFEMQYAERIFVVFKRLHHSDEYPGTGMGLAICKRIVERHGGRIWVTSEPQKGTSFFFTLPVSPRERLEPKSARPPFERAPAPELPRIGVQGG